VIQEEEGRCPSVGIGRLRERERERERERGREGGALGLAGLGGLVERLCRLYLELLSVADRKRRLKTVFVCFFACVKRRVTSPVSVETFVC
jgi:hypothetical protein